MLLLSRYMLLFMRTRPPLSLQLELLVSDGHNADLGIAMGVQDLLVPEIDVDGVTSQPESVHLRLTTANSLVATYMYARIYPIMGITMARCAL